MGIAQPGLSEVLDLDSPDYHVSLKENCRPALAALLAWDASYLNDPQRHMGRFPRHLCPPAWSRPTRRAFAPAASTRPPACDPREWPPSGHRRGACHQGATEREANPCRWHWTDQLLYPGAHKAMASRLFEQVACWCPKPPDSPRRPGQFPQRYRHYQASLVTRWSSEPERGYCYQGDWRLEQTARLFHAGSSKHRPSAATYYWARGAFWSRRCRSLMYGSCRSSALAAARSLASPHLERALWPLLSLSTFSVDGFVSQSVCCRAVMHDALI